ncbi:MAG: septum formation protein Maf [Myxococcales bacterium]|nr:septum formation protein Maf [Myxococcales bacterium]
MWLVLSSRSRSREPARWTTVPPMLVLASASPRRLDLLRQAGIEPLVDPADVDETPDSALSPAEDAARLARAKALTVASRRPEATVLAADTIVVVDGKLLGKPRDEADARAMLRRLEGRGHHVITAVHIVPPASAGWPVVALNVSTAVIFRALGDEEIERYLASGEWQGKAGGYAIQGGAAGFARAVTGSYTNVVGLPLAEVIEELRAVAGRSLA